MSLQVIILINTPSSTERDRISKISSLVWIKTLGSVHKINCSVTACHINIANFVLVSLLTPGLRFKQRLFPIILIISSPENLCCNSADPFLLSVTLSDTWDLKKKKLDWCIKYRPQAEKCLVVGSNLCRLFLQSPLLVLRVHQFLFRQQQLFVQGVCLLLSLTHTQTQQNNPVLMRSLKVRLALLS